jgi:hypothetical protein
MTPFDFVNAINTTKQNLFEDPQAEKDYIPYIVNKALSYYVDTIMYANLINQNSQIEKQWQFDFYRLTVPKGKRYSKWIKKLQPPDDIVAIQQYYKYSQRQAAEQVKLLTESQIEIIKQYMLKGGKNDRVK